MNTYNENLRNGVLASLSSMELDLKQIDSAANAAMFTLYFAEGATITAVDRLEAAKTEQGIRETIKAGAVANNNLSNNLLASANQATQYLKQSMTNTAVGASNVQIAANAVVRLAGDMGNILNIANAADFGTEIYTQAVKANQYMSDTAADAELASQWSMEASVLTSRVTGATVLTNAKSTNDAIGNLLKVLSADYDAISQVVATDNATLVTTSVTEQLAEGVYEDLHIEDNATLDAYKHTSKQLNLGLTASPVKGSEATKFNVTFDWIKSPFGEKNKKLPTYPVQNYYLFVVKDKQKLTFSINNAESIKQENPKRYISLHNYLPVVLPEGFSADFEFANIPPLVEVADQKKGDDGVTPLPPPNYQLKDTDGDDVQTGVPYVVFLFAEYAEEYKKTLNTFDDYLSAPSAMFTLTTLLAEAKITDPDLRNLVPPPGSVPPPPAKVIPLLPVVSFSVAENPVITNEVEYRCIFLQVSEVATSGMADASSLKALDLEITNLVNISETLGAEIAQIDETLTGDKVKLADLAAKYPDLYQILSYITKQPLDLVPEAGSSAKKQAEFGKNLLEKVNANRAGAQQFPTGIIDDLVSMYHLIISVNVQEGKRNLLQKQINQTEKKVLALQKSRIDFVFNKTLAENVGAGNYTKAQPDTDGNNSAAPPSTQAVTNNVFPVLYWTASVTDATTDNFGNILAPGKKYIPVIVSVSTAPEEELARFTNAWTGYNAKPVTIPLPLKG